MFGMQIKCFRVAGKNRVGQVTGNKYMFSFSLMMINNDNGLPTLS